MDQIQKRSKRDCQRRLCLIGCIIFITAQIVAMTGCSSSVTSNDYEKAYAIGLQAYVYGLPLVETDRTFHLMTDDVNSNGTVPINQFMHKRTFNNASSKKVVAPGANGLSSIAWLDLTEGPQVLHIPSVIDHYFVMALLDPYTEDLCNLGSANDTPAGDYVICGPSQRDDVLPPGTHQINVAYNRIWVIGSTQVKGIEDIQTVNKIQDSFTITPLSSYGKEKQAAGTGIPAQVKRDETQQSDLSYYDNLCRLLAQFPPSDADAKLLQEFASVGIGPGRMPSKDQTLSDETKKGLLDAAKDGPDKMKAVIKSVYGTSAKKHNGYFLGGFGKYGTNYDLRAAVALVGLGAMSSDQTIFALTMTDQNMKPLNGSQAYVMHLIQLPPATEGWSITVYDSSGALMGNPYNRYQFSDASNLTHNPDGSIDLYFQAGKPVEADKFKNWLPVEKGKGFQVMIRLLAPRQDQIDKILDGTGWQPSALIVNNH